MVTRRQALWRIKGVLGRIKGCDASEIFLIFRLRGRASSSPPGLGFDDRGLRRLRDQLVEEFRAETAEPTYAAVVDSATVDALRAVVWAAIPAHHREES